MQGFRQLDPSGTGLEISGVHCSHPLELRLQRQPRDVRNDSHPVLPTLPSPNGQLTPAQVEVLHP